MSSKPRDYRDELLKIYQQIKNQKTEEERSLACIALSNLTLGQSRDLTSEHFAKFANDLLKLISELIHSGSSSDKIGGITALEALIGSGTLSDRVTLMFNLLCRGGMTSKDERVLTIASQTLGRLIHIYGHSIGDLIAAELGRSLEWLTDPKSGHVLAALLIINQIASNASLSIYLHMSHLLGLIWHVLQDRDLNVRVAAKDTLQVCLRLINDRQSSSADTYHQQMKAIYDSSVKCLEQNHPRSEHLHGALLALNELVNYPSYFNEDDFQHVCDLVMKFWDSNNAMQRAQVTSLLPALAELLPQLFSQRHLTAIMKSLLAALTQRDPTERARAFITIGKLSLAVRSHMQDYVEEVLSAVRAAVSSKSKSVFKEALTCLSMLSTAVGLSMQKYAKELLQQIFSAGLSQELVDTLTALSQNIPELSFDIQLRLLDTITRVLTTKPLVQSGSLSRKIDKSGSIHEPEQEQQRIILALQTVGSFAFNRDILTQFSNAVLIIYLSHKDVLIRKEACLMCCKILARLPATVTTNDILTKLLETGIGDTEESIRLAIIQNLDASFDAMLAQHDKLSLLFLGIYDESFEIRERIINVLGRCAARNPAYVLPVLRKRLLELRDELAHSRDSVTCEQSARLLACLLGGPDLATSNENLAHYEADCSQDRSLYSPVHHRLVDPYVDSLLRVLINRAKDSDPHTVASVLRAVSAVVYQAPLELTTEHIEELLNMIAPMLQDHSSALKSTMALKCLNIVAQFTSPTMKSLLHKTKVYENVLDMLKTEQLPAVRSVVTSVMGTFGAVDSQWHRRMQLEDQKTNEASVSLRGVFSNEEEDAYARAVVDSLLRVINDSSLTAHHRQALQALVFLFDSLGPQCAQFFRAVLDALLLLIRNSDSLLREITLQQLASLITAIQESISEYVPEIMLLISEYWQAHPMQVLLLIEVAASSLNEGFEAYIPQITPYLVAILKEPSHQRLVKIKALHCVELISSSGAIQSLTRQLYVIVPAITSLFTSSVPIDVSHEALATVDKLVQRSDLSRYASSIVQPLTRVLNRPERQDIAMQVLCSLATQMRQAFVVFIPSIRNMLNQNNIAHITYNKLEERLLSGDIDEESSSEADRPAESTPRKYKNKLKINEQLLRKSWNTSSKSEDWHEWFRHFSVELLRESPSPAVRSCIVISDYYPIVRELFNVAFLSCWTSLLQEDQEELVLHLLKVFHSDTVPGDVLQALLDLAEFMEDNNHPLPIDVNVLIQLTERCRAYAKSLRYLETELKTSPNIDVIERLISVHNKLGLPEASNGIVKFAQHSYKVQLKASWYEKLGRWEKALAHIDKHDNSLDATLKRAHCLRALGEWQELSNLIHKEWPRFEQPTQQTIAPMALAASWALRDWDAMYNYVQILPAAHLEGAFYRAVYNIRQNNYNEAYKQINTARGLLGPELKVLLTESYQRAYHVLVRLQQLTEMTEVIDYKQNNDCVERQTALSSNWTERLKSCERDPDVWYQLLSVRSLAVDADKDVEVWLKFAALCRKNDRQHQAHDVLSLLLGNDLSVGVPEETLLQAPKISFAFMKLLWAENKQPLAFKYLQQFVVKYQGDYNLQARMLVKLGHWQISLQEALREENLSSVLETFKTATELDPEYQQGWHAWAMVNFDVIIYHENQLGHTKDAKAVADSIKVHLVPAVSSFFRAISLSNGKALQDTLRLLTLWFKYGASKQVEKALLAGFDTCPIETWLQVIPQLIARVHSPVEAVRRLLHDLIVRIGRDHAQALVFPLTVAHKSPSHQRVLAAREIIDRMRVHSAKLIDQSQLVSNELIRVGYLWPEICLDSIRQAHIMLAAQDVDGALEVLGQMHGELLKPQTRYEVEFLQQYGQALDQALAYCQKFVNEGHRNDLGNAWTLYKRVYDSIHKKLFQAFDLTHTSPQLFAAHNFDLAVPGSYKPHRPVVTITKFQSQLNVFQTKQRPRKMALIGSDGTKYSYLLKSREDLRLDERVMQLIRLVNTLLRGGHKTQNKKRSINTNKNLSHLSIAYYAVVPLSPDSGLIGWVPHSDTFNQLILDHRQAHNISAWEEHQFISKRGQYDTLTQQDKYAVLKETFQRYEPQDLAKILWSKSPSSEVWLERRTNFTRSLAVMSMVGYVLGLGDRHLSNMMLDRYTGQVIHIDFGDCFEVAMQRDRFAETVPFRLTRMFVNAMEVKGLEGIYRATSETVMTLMREHKESLMAVLEAFVYDPLINWRLMDTSNKSQSDSKSDEFTLDSSENDNFSLETFPDHSHERRSKSLDLDATSIEDKTPEQNNIVAAQVGALNQRALAAINRVNQKLSGRDFVENTTLDVSEQVTRLIEQATSLDNLCVMFSGWCPYW